MSPASYRTAPPRTGMLTRAVRSAKAASLLAGRILLAGPARELLDGPAVAVRVAEVDERAPGLDVDLADPDAASRELVVRGLDVLDDELEAAHRAGLGFGEADAHGDGARRAGRRELDETELRVHGRVVVEVEPGLVHPEDL